MLFNRYTKFDAPDDATGSAESGTPGDGSVTSVTPPQGAADGGKDYAKMYEELQRKSQSDINNLKSSLQSQMAQQKRQFETERERLLSQVQQTQLSSLDEDERKEYLKNVEIERAQQYKQDAAQYQRELEELKAASNYQNYFIAQGVPANKLVTDQGLEVLVNSGWAGIQELMTDMRTKLQQFESQSTATLNKAAPQSPADSSRTPISATPAPAANGSNWDALIKQYGTAEEVFRLVESGMLPPSIIPTT